MAMESKKAFDVATAQPSTLAKSSASGQTHAIISPKLKKKSASAVHIVQGAVSIVQGDILLNGAEIGAQGPVNIGHTTNIIAPATQAQAEAVLRAEQNIKREEKVEADIRKKQQLKQIFLTTLPQPLQEVIPRSNFTQQLTDGFQAQAQKSVPPVQIIHGMGGVGKTQLAINYANQYTQDKDFVAWIYADKHQLEGKWLAFGEKLIGRHLQDTPKAEQLAEIRYALTQHTSWLIVLDNLESQTALKGLLPDRLLPTQQILITTRSAHWGSYPVLALSPFTPAECHTYFEKRLTPQQCIDVELLVQELGYLPLALSHAVAYIKQTDKTAKAYLKLYREKGIAVLAPADMKNEADDAHYNATILTTYQLNIEELTRKNPIAAEVVKYCAYLHPDSIKKSFLKKLLAIDTQQMDQCIRDIRHYALLSKGGAGFTMHRLVQAVIRYQEVNTLQANLFAKRLRPLAQTLYAQYPFEKQLSDYDKARALLPHLEEVAVHLDADVIPKKGDENSASACQADVYIALTDFFWKISSESKRAVESAQKALKLNLTTYGSTHTAVAKSYSYLGLAYWIAGNEKEVALSCQQKALAINLALYGEVHRHVARSYNNLGIAYQELDNFQEALNCYQNAVALRLEVYEENHPHIADSYNNLGIIHTKLDNTQEALSCYQKALKIWLAAYGHAHPRIAISYLNLGALYRMLGDAQEALTYIQKALDINLTIYGKIHISVARSYDNYGVICKRSGNFKEALIFHQKALEIHIALYGEFHISVAKGYSCIGLLHQDLYDFEEALDCHQKALDIKLKTLGDEHALVAESYIHLGDVHEEQGNLQQALDSRKKALTILLKIYGDVHLKVAAVYDQLGSICKKIGELQQALTYHQKGLDIRLIICQNTDLFMANSYSYLASIHDALGNLQEALTCQQATLDILLANYGDSNHPHVAIGYSNLGAGYRSVHDYQKALKCQQRALEIRLFLYENNPHPHLAMSYKNLGELHNDLGNHQTALTYLKKALSLYEQFSQQSVSLSKPEAPIAAEANALNAYQGKVLQGNPPKKKKNVAVIAGAKSPDRFPSLM